jgi:Fe2+ or Zn2+ uptake regulation protein
LAGGRGVKVFDPARATENYRLVYEALRELGVASAMQLVEWVSRRKGRPIGYSDMLRKLGRLEAAGVVEKIRLVGASTPRVLWRLKEGHGGGEQKAG